MMHSHTNTSGCLEALINKTTVRSLLRLRPQNVHILLVLLLGLWARLGQAKVCPHGKDDVSDPDCKKCYKAKYDQYLEDTGQNLICSHGNKLATCHQKISKGPGHMHGASCQAFFSRNMFNHFKIACQKCGLCNPSCEFIWHNGSDGNHQYHCKCYGGRRLVEDSIYKECEPHREVVILDYGEMLTGSCAKCMNDMKQRGSNPRAREISPANGYPRVPNSLPEAKEILREKNGGRSDGGNGRPSSVNRGYDNYDQPQSYNRSPPSDYGRTSYGGQGEPEAYSRSLGIDQRSSYGGQGEPEAYSRSEGLDRLNDVYDKKLMCRNCDADTIGRNQRKFSKTNNPADKCPNGRSPYRGRKKDDHSWVSEKVWLELYGRRRLAEDNVNPLTAFCAWALMLLIVVVVYTLTKMGKRSAMQRRHLSKTQVAF